MSAHWIQACRPSDDPYGPPASEDVGGIRGYVTQQHSPLAGVESAIRTMQAYTIKGGWYVEDHYEDDGEVWSEFWWQAPDGLPVMVRVDGDDSIRLAREGLQRTAGAIGRGLYPAAFAEIGAGPELEVVAGAVPE